MKENLHKLKCKLILISLLLCVLTTTILMGYSSKEYVYYSIPEVKHKLAGQATTIDDYTLLELSTLDTLELNFKKLPTVTVNTAYKYVIEGEDGVNRGRPQLDSADSVKQPIRSVTFTNLPYNQKVDIEVSALFENCGTILGQSVDMKIVYSDFFSAPKYTGTSTYLQSRNNSKVLWWTAYGTIEQQTPENEWFQRGFQNINTKVYFYYHGENTPIHLNVAYFTLYSEDGGSNDHAEAASSKKAVQSFIFEDTTMAYLKSLTLGTSIYNDVYYGTKNSDSAAPKKAAISFKYKNADYIEVDMHILNYLWSAGYHVNFSALAATLPPVGTKEVNTTEVRPGADLIYTINQQLPLSVDDKFSLNSMIFTDELNENLNYKSLKVYNENNVDITSTAGTNNVVNNVITYTFKSSYLTNLTYSGQNYKFVIETTMKDVPTTGQITNSAVVKFNNSAALTTNSIPTNIISYVHIKRVDENGNEITETETLKGNIYSEYETEAIEIDKYELISVPDDASGTFDLEEKTITYVYKKLVKDIEVYKTWEDDASDISTFAIWEKIPTRPESINIVLSSNLNDDTQIIELNKANGWYYKFTDLKKYNDETGEEIIYTVTEENVPDGYYISSNSSENNIVTITNTKYGKITINKYDSDTNEPLKNATFKVEKNDGENITLVGEYTTNENGKAVVEKLQKGTYLITEIHAPEGYKLNTETFEVNVNISQFEYEIDVPNKPQMILPATGGDGIRFVVITGCLFILMSFVLTKHNKFLKRKKYFKHRY